ncbi:hypothetical protein [Streptomyces virginiae]|uniref:hypothetical protein n=1 Tax=Streptomyces virginiae TaxID=1961 RepID=UPI0037A1D363
MLLIVTGALVPDTPGWTTALGVLTTILGMMAGNLSLQIYFPVVVLAFHPGTQPFVMSYRPSFRCLS